MLADDEVRPAHVPGLPLGAAPHRSAHQALRARAAPFLERIAETRAGDTWRNLVAQLDTIKVVEYTHGEARVRQTTELRPGLLGLLKTIGVAMPPRLHAVEASIRSYATKCP